MSINYHNVLNHFLNKKKSKNFFAKDTLCEDYIWGIYPTCCNTLPQRNDGHLATIISAEEWAFLEPYVRNGEYWLGGSDVATEGEWQWVTGEPWSYTHWYSNEPNNSTEHDVNGENYLATYKSSWWNDLTPALLSEVSGFVCEWDCAL